MPSIHHSKIVPYTQAEMYALVNDVASYSEFVPWCASSSILTATTEELRATLSFSRGGIHKEFTTLNRLMPCKMIEISLVNGPFKHLEGFWRFESRESHQSRVSLDLAFEFSSHWMGIMFGPIFNQVANMLVECFIKRAQAVYGPRI